MGSVHQNHRYAVMLLVLVTGSLVGFAGHHTPLQPKPTIVTATLPNPLLLSTPTHSQEATSLTSGWTTVMSEDFEGTFPQPGWRVSSESGWTHLWGKRDCRAHGGSYSAWAHGGGSSGSQLPCGANYPPNLKTWLTYGPFSLENATAAELTFWFYSNTAPAHDQIQWTASIDGFNFYGYGGVDFSNGWKESTFDLSNVPVLGNLVGRRNVWIAFIFSSDSSQALEGVYVDDVVLRVQVVSGTEHVFLPLILEPLASTPAPK